MSVAQSEEPLGPLHAYILEHLISTGRAPGLEAIAAKWSLPLTEARDWLRRLQEHHGVVLHPHADAVWVIHPFSTAPTPFTVHADGQTWWANCAWCALGAAAVLDRDCRITTTLGAYGERADIHICGGEITTGAELRVHFPVPMTHAWDNVIYTCSVMLLFDGIPNTDTTRGTHHIDPIDTWCHRHGIARGDVRRVADVWPFAREWYGHHLSPQWEKLSLDRAREIFARHGLNHPVWSLPESGERF